ncbi:APC family permease [Leucobacter sp. OH1287]|uniref:APC family permease n=1 Tax=Leucobacter sp. OH1287 TaxID=2491049 RepID=UPI000F5E3251|nr:APC family permease [Leucobacter sp. OH1287]RRD60461.1 amino acid permease [Leucobacter sp. OH1287]
MNKSVKESKSELKRDLGTWTTLALGVGAMVGFGWVVLVGGWITGAGSLGAASAFLVGGIMMAIVALVYAELVAAMPLAGGEHNYIIRALGPKASLIGSWAITGGYATVVAFEAVALPRAIDRVVDLKSNYLWTIGDQHGGEVYLTWVLVGSLVAILITIINIIGVKVAGSIQVFVVIFLFIIGALQVSGLFFGRASVSTMEPFFVDGVNGFFGVLVIVPFMFVGFDVIPQAAEEANIAPKKIGRITFLSVIIAAAWYIMIVLTVSAALSNQELQSSLPAAEAMKQMFNSEFMAQIMVAAGVAGIITSWNSLQMGASRLLFSLSRGGMLPQWIGKLHPKYGTPINALLLLGAIATVAPFFGPTMLGWIVDAGSPMIVIAYLLVTVSFVVLRKREPAMDRPLRIGGKGEAGGLIIGLLGVLITAFLIVLYLPGLPASIGYQSWIIFGLWWIFGIFFLLRIPGGVRPGPNAEHELLELVEKRRAKR